MNGWLVVFAKEPAPGRVKTRLTPPFSPAQASQFYRCLLEDALDESAHAAALLKLDAVVAVDPPGGVAAIAARAPAGFRAISQAAGDLGRRMSAVAHQAAAAGAPFVLLRGSDSPCLERETLRAAAAALSQTDVVLCPDRDGGYNLVGLAQQALGGSAVGTLFEHPMSTPTVLRDTRARAEKLGLRVDLLPAGFDIDRFDDLRWLAAARAGARPLRCRRTLGFLDEAGLWPAPDGRAQLRTDPSF
ncbi:MAG: glycosyltransferase [Proteobacteria bacterium]|nr:MAG: glycosyltransferase [Pseudomonadota bacterium]